MNKIFWVMLDYPFVYLEMSQALELTDEAQEALDCALAFVDDTEAK